MIHSIVTPAGNPKRSSLNDGAPDHSPLTRRRLVKTIPIFRSRHFAENEQHSHKSVLGLYTRNSNRPTS